jgi:hypothetical protein
MRDMIHACLRFCRPLGVDCTKGAGAVEFAIIAPVFILLLLGIIEFSNIFLVQNHMTEVARDTVRQLATGRIERDEARSFVEERLKDKVDAEVLVTVTETSVDKGTDILVWLGVPLGDVAMFDLWFHSTRSSGSSESTAATTSHPEARKRSHKSSRSAADEESGPRMLTASAAMFKE